MIIHKVREPFLCREGQFNKGVRDLCIGLDYNTLKSTDMFWCYLGKNRTTHYEIDCSEALAAGQQWKNKRGKIVIIVPLSVAKKINAEVKEEDSSKVWDPVKRVFVERRLYFATCDGCGKINYQSFKRSVVKKGLCRNCRREVKLRPKDQMGLF